jgi:RAD51-like protein 2
LGKISEVCGAAGLGKTQLCMQLCVNVQIPERFGGLGAKAIYIDTEGSFVSNRLVEIANSTMRLLQKKFSLETRNGTVNFAFFFVIYYI